MQMRMESIGDEATSQLYIYLCELAAALNSFILGPLDARFLFATGRSKCKTCSIRPGAHMKQIMIMVMGLMLPVDTYAEQRTIDTQRSVLTIRVYKAGLFSAFGHDHNITAPIARGSIDDSENPAVELWVDSGKLRVVDTDLSAKDRAEVQKTMEGPEVLDVRQFAEIRFRSTSVEKLAANRWTVRGDLDLHGQRRPVAAQIAERQGAYVGSVTLKQRDFGISPVSVAGGTVKVKDQIKIDIEIYLTR